ncbi:MAG: replicative DNA helicase [Candidatus Mcinerneyibacterium aminivorans]|uniref:Replicative DNA helicase n=1 Tax=Candidatus Mcinerneyibacterium aminivorans TaxID=2703815 RepID=A0A5D0MEN9_9BACT|nr:MAG: replicative DNA helicase [Candidatus Mcinerneyibacterium aminivorans]
MSEYYSKSQLSQIELYDLEAESALLGALFINNEKIPHVLDELRENIYIFKLREHQVIYYAIVELFKDKTRGVDSIVVKDFLNKCKKTPEGRKLDKDKTLLDLAGGNDYIQQIQMNASTLINYDEYIKIIRNKYILRKLLKVLNEVYDETISNMHDVDYILENAEKRIFDIVQEKKVKRSYSNLKQIVDKQIEHIEKIKETGGAHTDYITTGYKLLDQKTGGFKPGQLIILAARPAMGKTAFSLNIARNVAKDLDKGVAFFSLEMAEEEIAQRFLFMESEIKGHDAMQGYLSSDEFDKLYEAGSNLVGLPIVIDDTAGLTPIQMKAKLRRIISREEIDVVVVDYLQLMNTNENFNNMNAKITVISRYLKEIAKEFNVPVIALSQLSRKTEQRQNKRPKLSDLRESGAIEQDADMVLFLFREGYYNKKKDETETEIIISKNRNGPTGIVKLTFFLEYGKFESMSLRKRK